MKGNTLKKCLNGNQLKLIAIIAMTIDHLTWVLFPGFQTVWWVLGLHIIGRLTAPIMWFFIAEGCFYTHDRRKYLMRLFGFAVVSHFAYDFAFGIPFFDAFVILFSACIISLPSDWSSIAVMAPFFIYNHRGKFKLQALDIVIWTAVYALVYFFAIDKLYAILQMFTFLSVPLLFLYNGKRGKWKGMKWLFYVYYPAHLVVIGVLRLLLHGDIRLIA